MALAPVQAAGPFSPAGTWQMTDGSSRFKVELCGDGTQVCAQLIWLRKQDRTVENLKYLNSYVLKGAKRATNTKWRGNANYKGETIRGTLTMVDRNNMTLNGCKGALCKKLSLTRL
jgi:hypothetical protein